MKSKAEFIEHCVLMNHMTGVEAMRLWKETQKIMWDDWAPDLSSPGPFLQTVWEALDAASEGTRRTFIALLRERYNENTGGRR